MTKKEMFVKAHEMAREIKAQYPEVDYKFQFTLCLSYLQKGGNDMKVKVNETVEFKGFEITVKEWNKGENHRIYFNGKAVGAEHTVHVGKEYEMTMYLDLNTNKYYTISKSDRAARLKVWERYIVAVKELEIA